MLEVELALSVMEAEDDVWTGLTVTEVELALYDGAPVPAAEDVVVFAGADTLPVDELPIGALCV